MLLLFHVPVYVNSGFIENLPKTCSFNIHQLISTYYVTIQTRF
jgi:hypothetical protein